MPTDLDKDVSQITRHYLEANKFIHAMLAERVHRRKFLNIFPIRSYVENMSVDGGHLGWRVGSLNIILKGDHLKTNPPKFGPNRPSSFREDF